MAWHVCSELPCGVGYHGMRHSQRAKFGLQLAVESDPVEMAQSGRS